jgi:mono/diheme cytochrome c family protein
MRICMVIAVVAGCVSESDDRPRERTYAEQAWLAEALPVFKAYCIVCHWGSGDTPSFLAGDMPAEIRHTVLASGVVNLAEPESSRVLVKGAHSGPRLFDREARKILHWLQAERDER